MKLPTQIQPKWAELSFQDLMTKVRTLGIGLENNRPWSNDNDFKGSGRIKYQTLNKLSHPLRTPSDGDLRRIGKNVEGLLALIDENERNSREWTVLIEAVLQRLRDDIGIGRSDYDFGALQVKFGTAKGKKVGLFGATYVDVTISPITVNNLSRDVSYTNLTAPRVSLGGGVVIFGKEFKQKTGQECQLHTVVGSAGDSFEAAHKDLLQIEIRDWLSGVTETTNSLGTPVAFHLHNLDEGTRCVFAYNAPTKAMADVDTNSTVDHEQYGIVFTSYPEAIQARLKVPCVASYGYQTPGGAITEAVDPRKKALLSGHIDLLFGSFYEFARLWSKLPPDARKWDRTTRGKILGVCFAKIRGNTAVIVRDFNYGKPKPELNIFLIVAGKVLDLTLGLPKHQPSADGFFMDARKFDATLVALLVSTPYNRNFGPKDFRILVHEAVKAAFPV